METPPFTYALLTNYWSLHPVNLVLTDIKTQIPITVSILEVFSRVSIGQCFNFQNYTVFSGACTQNNNTESPNLWLSHLQNGVFSYFISIVIILGPPPNLPRHHCPSKTPSILVVFERQLYFSLTFQNLCVSDKTAQTCKHKVQQPWNRYH